MFEVGLSICTVKVVCTVVLFYEERKLTCNTCAMLSLKQTCCEKYLRRMTLGRLVLKDVLKNMCLHLTVLHGGF